MANIKARTTKLPRFRCYRCRAEFDDPLTLVEVVDTYRSRHDAAWVDLDGCLSGAVLRSLCESTQSQLSIRRLSWSAFRRALANTGRDIEVRALEQRSARAPNAEAFVRVRIGDSAHRRKLLASHDPVCAVTGRAPTTLEAGQLYRYASIGVSRADGELLLRRDVVPLLDAGEIAVDPTTLRIRLRASVAECPAYEGLQGAQLHMSPTPAQLRWIDAHWAFHRLGD